MHSLLDRSTILVGLVDELRPLLPSLGGALSDLSTGNGHGEAAEQALETAFMIRAAAEMLELESLQDVAGMVEELVGILKGAPDSVLREAAPTVQALLAALGQATEALIDPNIQALTGLETARSGLKRLGEKREQHDAAEAPAAFDLERMLATLPLVGSAEVGADESGSTMSPWAALQAVAAGAEVQEASGVETPTAEQRVDVEMPSPVAEEPVSPSSAWIAAEPSAESEAAVLEPAVGIEATSPSSLWIDSTTEEREPEPEPAVDEVWKGAFEAEPTSALPPRVETHVTAQEGDYSWWDQMAKREVTKEPAPIETGAFEPAVWPAPIPAPPVAGAHDPVALVSAEVEGDRMEVVSAEAEPDRVEVVSAETDHVAVEQLNEPVDPPVGNVAPALLWAASDATDERAEQPTMLEPVPAIVPEPPVVPVLPTPPNPAPSAPPDRFNLITRFLKGFRSPGSSSQAEALPDRSGSDSSVAAARSTPAPPHVEPQAGSLNAPAAAAAPSAPMAFSTAELFRPNVDAATTNWTAAAPSSVAQRVEEAQSVDLTPLPVPGVAEQPTGEARVEASEGLAGPLLAMAEVAEETPAEAIMEQAWPEPVAQQAEAISAGFEADVACHGTEALDIASGATDGEAASASDAAAEMQMPESLRVVPDIDPEILEVFMEEATEVLASIRVELEQMRAVPGDRRAAGELRRACHTLKGAANVVGFPSIGLLCKSMEDLLDALTDAGVTPTATTLQYLDRCCETFEPLMARPAEPELLAGVAGLAERGRSLTEEVNATPAVDDEPISPDDMAAWSEAVTSFLGEDGQASEAELVSAQADAGAPAEAEGMFSALWAAALADAEPAVPAREIETVAVSEPNDELVATFALEAEEHLAALIGAALRLDIAAGDAVAVAQARRTLHTLKGAAGALGLSEIGGICHETETQLDQQVATDMARVLFEASESLELAIRRLNEPEAPFQDGVEQATAKDLDVAAAPTAETVQMLELEAAPAEPVAWSDAVGPDNRATANELQIVEPGAPELMAAAASEDARTEVISAEAPTTGEQVSGTEADNLPAPVGTVRVDLNRVDDLLNLVGEVVITRFGLEQRLERMLRSADELRLTVGRLRRVAQFLEDRYEVAELLRATSEEERYGDFDELEMDRYTELHQVSREVNELAADSEATSDDLDLSLKELDGLVRRQSNLGTELQDRLMAVRLVQVGTLGARLQLAARTVASRQGKELELSIHGGETELDKRVVEELGDVMVHLVRNAVDHGLELPEQRELAGKPRRGALSLRAYREGNEVAIQFTDDGRGIDLRRLRQRAEAMRLVQPDQEMDQQELMNLIFQPGFSTSTRVTEVSGRGVGLDAVQAAVSRLKGSLEVTTEPGQGTTFTMRLPVVLAVLQAMIVNAGEHSYAIPMAALDQVVRGGGHRVTRIGTTPVVEIGGQAFPYLDLAASLGQGPSGSDEHSAMLVVRTGERRVALAVGELLGQQEVVVKPLGPHLRVVRGVLGATIMGNGQVVLVLNTTELLSPSLPAADAPPPRASEEQAPSNRPLSALVVDDSISVRKVLARTLERDGWQVAQARDGVNALEVLQDFRPSVVLMDIEMPRMDGFELASVIRKVDDYGNPPIVMITSRGGDKHRLRAEELGVDGYLVKPYQEVDLLATLRRLAAVGHRG